ncbi:MAG: NTP transferase domain-containing protein [Desulfobacterales bacterium]
MTNALGVIILAAGLGTRMKSDKAKVLHELNGRPMVLYVVDVARKLAGDQVIVVVGYQADRVQQVVTAEARVRFAIQTEQLGTGHAVSCAMDAVPPECERLVILCGDVPLLELDTLRKFVAHHDRSGSDVTVLAVELDNPKGYGRILVDDSGGVSGIVEEADATTAQKGIRLVNTGIYCVSRAFLESALEQIQTDNAQGEFYLTDMISIAYREGRKVEVSVGKDPLEFIGINSREDLEAVERFMQRQRANIA